MKKGIFSLLLFACSTFVYAQNITVSGTVIDDSTNETLIGVNITEKESSTGTITNDHGFYQIDTEVGKTLVFKYVGFETQEIIIALGQKEVDVSMVLVSTNLNQVVVSASRRNEKILNAPASISTIDADLIKKRVNINSTDMLKDLASVDVIKTGIQGNTVVVRGFNNYFSSDLLSMVDNRVTRVPSFRNNAYYMIQSTDDDVERIEVLRGPASALYGPNSDAGVMHIITKSPIDYQGTTFSYGIGMRAMIKDTILIGNPDQPRFDDSGVWDRHLMMGSFRHAHKIELGKENKVQVGYKVSGKYFQGNDWKYDDPNEPDSLVRGIQTNEGRIELTADGEEVGAGQGDIVNNGRDEYTQKYSLDARVDFRFGKHTEVILSGGYNNASGLEITPISAAQSKNWKYYYAQARMRYKKLFAQVYTNINNTGESFLLSSGDVSIDKSKLLAFQTQHSSQPWERLNLVYGLDAFVTLPNTNNTINGRYEDDDNMQEYGGYLHADVKAHDKLDILTAVRVDYHNRLDKIFVSPRMGLVYKPVPGQTIRATFNRAFRAPGANGFFLDVLQTSLDNGIDVRAKGNIDGYAYNYANNPFYNNQLLAQFRTPYGDGNNYYDVGDQQFNNTLWTDVLTLVGDGFKEQAAELNPAFLPIIDILLEKVVPNNLEGVGHAVKDLNLTSQEYSDADWVNLQDIDPLVQQEAWSYELGYKGIVAKSLFVTADVYYTQIKNYLAPTTLISPLVVLEENSLRDFLQVAINDSLAANSDFNNILVTMIDGNPQVGNGNGQVDDELVDILIQAGTQFPLGTVSPTSSDGADMLVATRNIGDVSVWGFDLSMGLYLSKDLKLSGSYSFVNKDSIPVEGAQFGYIALNAPKHKVGFGAQYSLSKYGLNLGARFKWQDGFPANSGAYVGRVQAYHEMDLDVSWTPNFMEKFNIAISVQNIYNNKQQFFVGAPLIGRSGMMRVSYTL